MKAINFKKATNSKSNAEKALKQMLESSEMRLKMSMLDKIYQLPPDYRQEAAKEFRVFDIWRHNGIGMSFSEKSIFDDEGFLRKVESKISIMAYRMTDWGRKQNTYSGSRVLDFPAKMRTESEKRGKWTGYDYHSDYSLFFHRSKPQILFSFDGKCYTIDFSEPTENFIDYIHISQQELFDPNWSWDSKELAVKNEDGEVYHVRQKDLMLKKEDGNELCGKIATAFLRRKEQKKSALEKMNVPDDLVIKASHSMPHTSGNCEIGTDSFRKQYSLTEKDEYTIAELKAKGVDFSNTYFQRAIQYAMNQK